MHSSRMRTARLLPVSPSIHCTGGVSAMGSVCYVQCYWGCLLLAAVSSAGLLLVGGSATGDVSQHALRQTLPPLPCEQID